MGPTRTHFSEPTYRSFLHILPPDLICHKILSFLPDPLDIFSFQLVSHQTRDILFNTDYCHLATPFCRFTVTELPLSPVPFVRTISLNVFLHLSRPGQSDEEGGDVEEQKKVVMLNRGMAKNAPVPGIFQPRRWKRSTLREFGIVEGHDQNTLTEEESEGEDKRSIRDDDEIVFRYRDEFRRIMALFPSVDRIVFTDRGKIWQKLNFGISVKEIVDALTDVVPNLQHLEFGIGCYLGNFQYVQRYQRGHVSGEIHRNVKPTYGNLFMDANYACCNLPELRSFGVTDSNLSDNYSAVPNTSVVEQLVDWKWEISLRALFVDSPAARLDSETCFWIADHLGELSDWTWKHSGYRSWIGLGNLAVHPQYARLNSVRITGFPLQPSFVCGLLNCATCLRSFSLTIGNSWSEAEDVDMLPWITAYPCLRDLSFGIHSERGHVYYNALMALCPRIPMLGRFHSGVRDLTTLSRAFCLSVAGGNSWKKLRVISNRPSREDDVDTLEAATFGQSIVRLLDACPVLVRLECVQSVENWASFDPASLLTGEYSLTSCHLQTRSIATKEEYSIRDNMDPFLRSLLSLLPTLCHLAVPDSSLCYVSKLEFGSLVFLDVSSNEKIGFFGFQNLLRNAPRLETLICDDCKILLGLKDYGHVPDHLRLQLLSLKERKYSGMLGPLLDFLIALVSRLVKLRRVAIGDSRVCRHPQRLQLFEDRANQPLHEKGRRRKKRSVRHIRVVQSVVKGGHTDWDVLV